jgi:hypothetical protein
LGFLNKLEGASFLADLMVPGIFLAIMVIGGDMAVGTVSDFPRSEAPWGSLEVAPAVRSSSTAAWRRPSPSCCCTFWPIRRPLQAGTLVVLRLLVIQQRPGFFNLQAYRPNRRPLHSNTASISGSTPSGEVPGGGIGGRALEFQFEIGGEGPDGVFHFLSGVLFVKVEGYVVFSFSSVVLGVICNPTV